MSNNSTFRLSFQVRHPSIAASEIAKAFDMPTKRFQSVGEPRMSPVGEMLGGNYERTSVGFEIHEHAFRCDDFDIEDLIREQLEIIDTKYTVDLVDTGGECAFFLGIFTDSNVGFELGNEVNDILSVSKIKMWFDIYEGLD